MTTQSLNFKLDADLKSDFESVAKGIGLSTSALLTVLIKRTVAENAIPFRVENTALPEEGPVSFESLPQDLQESLLEGASDVRAHRVYTLDQVRNHFATLSKEW